MRFIEDCKTKKELCKYLKLSKEDILFLENFSESANQYGLVLVSYDMQTETCKKNINNLSEYRYKFKTRHINGYGEKSILFVKQCRILIEWGKSSITCVDTEKTETLILYGIDNTIWHKLKEFRKD